MKGATLFADTIFALSSGAMPSGVAVIRVSGPATRNIVAGLAGCVPEPRAAKLCILRGSSGEAIDQGLVLFFPAPRSVTGEDCVEFQVHGGRAVVAAIFDALGARGARPAEAGEFTRRAFVNGKMDLQDVEALADLIDAQTEGQRRFAILNASSERRTLYEGWRARLIRMQAGVEAVLDFSDQDDITEDLPSNILEEAAVLRDALQEHAGGYARAEIIREGFKVVLLGAPNAGKSSMLNALARRDVAIVTEEAGTTRDLLEVELDVEGVKVVLVDTAGLRTDPGRVEALGIERALERARSAQLVLFLVDVAVPLPAEVPDGVKFLRIGTKGDLDAAPGGEFDLIVSVLSGQGMEALISRLGREAAEAVGSPSLLPFRARHVDALKQAAAHLENLASLAAQPELAAEELRLAARALGRITGAIETEEVLGAIFSTFCIGK